MAKFLFLFTVLVMAVLGYAAVVHAPLLALVLLAIPFLLLVLSTVLAYFDGKGVL